VDCHVHLEGREKVDEILKAMDSAGIDVIFAFSAYPGRIIGYGSYVEYDLHKQREVAEHVANLQKEAPDRIVGFLWLEPLLEKAVEVLEWAVTKLELRGVKMIPNHWYPYDEKLLKVYEKIEELNVPIIFHSGILWGFGDSSRFCRPANYEILLKFPKIRFALAHIGWPWVDECIATWGHFRVEAQRAGRRDIQMYIDATPGTPPLYRKEALQKVFAYGAEDYVIFGSDSHIGNLVEARKIIERDITLLRDHIGLPETSIRKYLGENALRFVGIRK